MTTLIPFDFDSHLVRVVMQGDEPWFVAGDVAAVLGFDHPPHMMRLLDDDEKGVHNVDTLGGEQAMTIMSESGLYSAVLRSRRPEARRFRKWVTAELLPTIRRTGRWTPATAEPPPVGELEPQRLTAIVAVVRMALKLYGRAAAQALWVDLGMPDYRPALPDSADPFARPIAALLARSERVTIADAGRALGLGPKVPVGTAQRIGRIIRGLGWHGKMERIGRQVVTVFRPAAV